MNRVIVFLYACVTSSVIAAKTEMKIEGSCWGEHNKSAIEFNYYSTFNGCRNISDAALEFTSAITPVLKGTRSIRNDLDSYAFKAKRDGQLKTVYWLVFDDSTGNSQGLFKFRNAQGSQETVVLECKIYDYHYSECLH